MIAWRYFLCFASALGTVAHAQTLQLVSPIQTGSETVEETGTLSISALGVGADGMTTYVEIGAETLAVEIFGTATLTLLSEPISYTATFEEDASNWIIGTTGSGLFESCSFGTTQGACVQQFVGQGGTSTLTTTYSGPVEPWYTLNAAAASQPTPPPTSPSGFSTSTSPTSIPTASNTNTFSSSSSSSPTVPTPSTNAAISLRWSVWEASGIILLSFLLVHAL